MAIKNLELYFDRKEENVIFLKTEAGEEIVVPSFLIEESLDCGKKIYLNIDNSPFIPQSDQISF